MKLRATVLGLNGIPGYDAIGIVLSKYLDNYSDTIYEDFSMEDVFCESIYDTITAGDLLIIRNQENPQTALAIAREFFSEEIEDSVPKFEVIATVDISKSLSYKMIEKKKEDILHRIKTRLGEDNYNRSVEFLNGYLTINTDRIDMTDEISNLVDRYNRKLGQLTDEYNSL